MEPNHATAASPDGPAVVSPELVLLNGRLQGTRRPLPGALTLVGRAAGCDVRLNVDSIAPFHCVVVRAPDAWQLRDLGSPGGTLVNGEAVSSCDLHDGDLLTIGPFRFRLHLPEIQGEGTRELFLREMEALQREKEALRIQAAAVVAQQAGLAETESRLEQRRGELQKQEEQLAGHLEEKRAKLIELQNQVREARAALQEEREELEKARAETQKEFDLARQQTAAARQQVEKDKQRLLELRKRFKARWHKQWDGERELLKRREEELTRRQREVEQQAETLHKDQAALTQARLRHNGDIEIGRRQVQDGWSQLYLAKRRWQESRSREEAQQEQRRTELERRAADVLAAERDIAEERQRWLQSRADLEKEVEGLNNRVRNLRRKLLDQEQELTHLGTERIQQTTLVLDGADSPTVVLPPASDASAGAVNPSDGELADALAVLERLAGEVADQRLHLMEQSRRFAEARQRWQEDRQHVLRDLEELALRLEEREQAIGSREQELEAQAVSLRLRDEQLTRQRHDLEGSRSRLRAREVAWEGERLRLLADVQSREAQAQQQLEVLTTIKQRWSERRELETKERQADHERCHHFRQQYVAQWEEYFRRQSQVQQQQKALAERALAMEQYRLEVVGKSPNSARAERRIERLRRRWVALAAASERELTKEREGIEAEARRLQELSEELQRKAAGLLRQEEDLAGRREAWEHEQGIAELASLKFRQEIHNLKLQRDHCEHQLTQLRDELERLANTLIEEPETPQLLRHSRAA